METNRDAKVVKGIEGLVSDREYVLNNCMIKVVSGFRNMGKLDGVPHRMHCDLAELCILRVEIEGAGIGRAVAIINQGIINRVGIGEDELFEAARRNTAKKLVLLNFSQVMNRTLTDDDGQIYMATNQECLYGGAAIVFPDFLKTVSERIRDDFWIIPSSIHEILIVPKSSGMHPVDIKKIVETVNRNMVSFDETLSDNVYETDKDGNLKVAV